MHMLNRRTQILLDEDRYARLERRARERGCSIATLIREAIDDKLGAAADDEARRAAGEWLLAAPAPDAREPDWAESKRAMVDSHGVA
jgi:hypothetical protein